MPVPVASATPKPNILGYFLQAQTNAGRCTPKSNAGEKPASATTNAAPAPGGGGGLVWVNTESHVFHREGSYYYGKTKQGKYMTEAEALKEGDRAAAGGH